MKKMVLIIVVLAMSFMLMAAGYAEVRETFESSEDYIAYAISDLEENNVPYTIEVEDGWTIIRFDAADYEPEKYVGSNPYEVGVSENCIIMHSTGTYQYYYGHEGCCIEYENENRFAIVFVDDWAGIHGKVMYIDLGDYSIEFDEM